MPALGNFSLPTEKFNEIISLLSPFDLSLLTSPPTFKTCNILDLPSHYTAQYEKNVSSLSNKSIRCLKPSKWNNQGWRQPTGRGTNLSSLQIISHLCPPLFQPSSLSAIWISAKPNSWHRICRKEWNWLLHMEWGFLSLHSLSSRVASKNKSSEFYDLGDFTCLYCLTQSNYLV